MAYKYSIKTTENCSKAVGVALPISFKQSIMICQAIRGLRVSKAKKILEETINFERPIKFTRFTNGLGHKPGILPDELPIPGIVWNWAPSLP